MARWVFSADTRRRFGDSALTSLALTLAFAACAGQRSEVVGGDEAADDGASGDDGDHDGDGDDGDGDGDGGIKLDVAPGGGDGGDGDAGPMTSCAAAAEDKSSMGCQFWAVDLPNCWAHSILNPPDTAIPAEQQFAVVVANASYDQSAKVDVYLEGSLIDSATVGVEEIHTFNLPRNDIDAQTSSTNGTAFFIESDVPIAAYQFQPLDNLPPPYSNDASLLFPQHSFAADYMAVTSYATSMNVQGGPSYPVNIGTFVSVVATEDGTTVDTYPTAPTAGGPTADVTIDRGEVFTIIGDGNTEEGKGNLSGTRVHADKPVAVFSGNVGAHEPLEVAGCCLDHIEHQLLPMSAWSNVYIAPPPPRYDGKVDESSVFRFIGAFDGTTLEYSPEAPAGAPATIDANETVAFTTKQPFVVSGSEPFAVTQFLLSNGSLGYNGPVPGDPAMWVVPPVDQHQAKYVFLSPEGYDDNFVTIVGKAGISIELDGEQVTGQFHMTGEVDGAPYTHIHVPVEPGSHLIEAQELVGIAVFGYGVDVSYAYPGGSGIKYIYEPPPPPQG